MKVGVCGWFSWVLVALIVGTTGSCKSTARNTGGAADTTATTASGGFGGSASTGQNATGSGTESGTESAVGGQGGTGSTVDSSTTGQADNSSASTTDGVGGEGGSPDTTSGAGGTGTVIPDEPDVCVEPCTEGLVQCGETGVEECQLQSDGCTVWVVTSACGSNQTCTEASETAECQCNASVCTEEGTACQDAQTLVTCQTDADGCLYLAATDGCEAPESCGGIAPDAACSLTCSDSCSQGQTACVDGGVASCTLGSNGCWSYSAPVACPSTQQSCTGSAGAASCTCDTDPVCKSSSATCANATTLANCAEDAQGCFFSNSTSTCNNGACSGGSCCTNTCDDGDTSCIDGGLATCTQLSNGCYAYGTPADCPNTGAVCSGSTCSCPNTTTLCGSACVDTATDPDNCGACGRSCMGGSVATGQCVASVCKPFTLQSIGPLTAPLLIDPMTVPLTSTATNLYATLSGTAAVSINAQTGAVLPSPNNIYASSSSGPSGIFSQNASTLYGLHNPNSSTTIKAISKSTMQASNVVYPTQPNGNDFWVGVYPGSTEQLCVLARWPGEHRLHCSASGSSTGDSTLVCWDAPDSTCPRPDQFAADATGLVWGAEGVGEEDPVGLNQLFLGTPPFTSKTTLTLPAGTRPAPILVSTTYIYWYDIRTTHLFYKTQRQAGGVTTQLSSTATSETPAQLAVDASYLYFTQTVAGTVSRVPINGASPSAPVVLATAQVGPTGIAVDSNAVYWINTSGNALMKLRKP